MPIQNKACYERHIQKCQDNHRQRLAMMKPTIDCQAPYSMRKVATKTNAKKQQMMVSFLVLISAEQNMIAYCHIAFVSL